MFKSRNFFMGLGIGLIVTSIFLMSYSGSLSKQVSAQDQLGKLKEMAESKHMSLYSESELIELKARIEQQVKEDMNQIQSNPNISTNNEPNTDTNKDSMQDIQESNIEQNNTNANDDNTNEVINESNDANNSETTTNQDSTSTSEEINITESSNNTTTSENQEEDIQYPVYFAIPDGMKSYDVAEYLYNIKVLQDRDAFNILLEKQGLDTKIIAQIYRVDKPLTTEELVELVTKINKENLIR